MLQLVFYVIGQAIYVRILWFLLSVFFSSPNLTGRRLDVYHTSTHGVALVQIFNAGLKSAARGSLEIQDAKNPGQENRGLDGVLYKLTVRL